MFAVIISSGFAPEGQLTFFFCQSTLFIFMPAKPLAVSVPVDQLVFLPAVFACRPVVCTRQTFLCIWPSPISLVCASLARYICPLTARSAAIGCNRVSRSDLPENFRSGTIYFGSFERDRFSPLFSVRNRTICCQFEKWWLRDYQWSQHW